MFSNGTGRSYGGGVVHCVSQEPQSNARHPQKSPNLQTWEMWANMFHTKICNHNCWSEVAGPIHRGVEKPQKPTNLQPHLCAFGQIHKKCTFLQHVRVLLLSFKANLLKVNAVKIIKWHGIQLLYWGRISSAPMLWCPSTWSTIVKFFADWVLLVA